MKLLAFSVLCVALLGAHATPVEEKGTIQAAPKDPPKAESVSPKNETKPVPSTNTAAPKVEKSFPRFRCDYTYDDNVEGWFKVHVTPANRTTAVNTCLKEDAAIAIPNTVKLEEVLMGLMKKSSVTKIHTGIVVPFRSSSSMAKVFTENGGLEPLLAENMTLPYICHKPADQVNPCDKGYRFELRTGKCYKFHDNKSDWYSALVTCSAEKGSLVIINSIKEAEVIKDVYSNFPKTSDTYMDAAFIGFWSKDNGKTWVTIEEKSRTLVEAGYAKFRAGEPNNAKQDEYCGSVDRNGKLQDDSCMIHLPFICEKEPLNNNCDTCHKPAKQ